MHDPDSIAAHMIATAIYAVDERTGKRQPIDQMEDSLYCTIELLQYNDEQKADIYATLAENLTATTTYIQAVATAEAAIARATGYCNG